MCVGRKSEGSLMLMMLMKRYNNLIEKIATKENIELADKKARKGKSNTYGVRNHDKDKDWENFVLELTLNNQSYTTSRYEVHEIFEPKRRLIFRLPYYPDRIAHHAIMNILEPIWTKIFIKNTYSCIKERGITFFWKIVWLEEFLQAITYLNSLLIYILLTSIIGLKKNLNVNSIIVMQMIQLY